MSHINGFVPPILLDEREAAKLLAISPRKLWSIRTAGEVPFVRIGRSVRYAYDELKGWVDRSQQLPQPSAN